MPMADRARIVGWLMALLMSLVQPACGTREAGESAGVTPTPPRAAAAPGLVLQLDEEALSRLDVKIEPAVAGERAAEVLAYGRVLDPAPAADAFANLAAARAAADNAGRELARVRRLARDRSNASERELEAASTAEARARADLRVADHRVDAVLGEARGGIDDLEDLGRRLSRRQAALVRVDVPIGPERPEPERGARLVVHPETDAPVAARYLGTSPEVDPLRPGWSFLFLVGQEAPSFDPRAPVPRPGSLAVARLATGGESLSGVHVPQSALVRNGDRQFVFVARGPGRFERRAVSAIELLDGSAMLTSGVEVGDPVVVRGAQQLLSAQLLSAGATASPE